MKKTFTLGTLVLCVATILFYSSCGKHVCAALYSGANPFIYFRYQNSQGMDLLDPATPNHYDTAVIKKLNTGRLTVSKSGVTPVVIIIQWINNPPNTLVELSYSHQDTVSTDVTYSGNSCVLTAKLNGVKYNGIAVITDPLFVNPFIIHK